MKKIISIILVLIIVVGGAVGFSALSDVNGSDKPGTEVTIDVPKGSGANTIGKILADNGYRFVTGDELK